MNALRLWLEISAENKQVRSKGKLCSKLMPRCKNVPRALSICQQRERERSTLFSLSLPHSTVCCILKIRACTGNSWRCLPPLHLRPSTHSQRQKIPEPETETETAPSWSCRAAGTQLLLASFCCLRCCFVLADWQTACQQGGAEGEEEEGTGETVDSCMTRCLKLPRWMQFM